MHRRGFLHLVAAAATLPAGAGAGIARALPADDAKAPSGTPHRFEDVVDLARRLAEAPFVPPTVAPPPGFADLDAAGYAALVADAEVRIGLATRPETVAEPLPPGYVYTDPVAFDVVEGGRARPLPFAPERFLASRPPVGSDAAPAGDGAGPAFSGFRLLQAADAGGPLEEVAVFQGASGLRARHRLGRFGASARGLAVATASPEGEETPRFTRFWLHRAAAEPAEAIEVHALLDSPSVAGAYAFAIASGERMAMDVRCRLFPRVELAAVGIAPLASMHLFGPDTRRGADDIRDAVHDSDGLQMITGRGERLWRPLGNPAALRLSGFVDRDPRAFGLAQRARGFGHYGDAAAGYERRPSIWVEPRRDWGPGQVVLVEVPLPSEVNDNILAFWRPEAPLAPGAAHAFDYRLTWAALIADPAPLARVVATRSGADGEASRLFAVDFDRAALPAGPLEARLSASQGSVGAPEIVETPEPARVRVVFRFAPEGAELSEFRLLLAGPDGRAASETWLYRWTRA